MPLKDGDIVLVNYTIKYIEDGKEVVYETTVEDVAKEHGLYREGASYRPVPIIIGRSKLIDALEKVIRELDVGEKRVVEAEPSEAYGEYRRDLVKRIPLKVLREHLGRTPVVGEEVELPKLGRGRVIRVLHRYADVDFNHPLAGKRLKIEIEVVRKITEPAEKIKFIAARWLSVDEEAVEASIDGEGNAVVRIPLRAAKLDNFPIRLTRLIEEVLDAVPEAKRLDVALSVDLEALRAEVGAAEGEQAAGGEEAVEEAAGEAKESPGGEGAQESQS